VKLLPMNSILIDFVRCVLVMEMVEPAVCIVYNQISPGRVAPPL
jgi:hypothetical protein